MIFASSLRSAIAIFHDFVLFLSAKPALRGDEGLDDTGVSETDLGGAGLCFGRLCCECNGGRGGASGAVTACSRGIGRGLGTAWNLSGLPRKLDRCDLWPVG